MGHQPNLNMLYPEPLEDVAVLRLYIVCFSPPNVQAKSYENWVMGHQPNLNMLYPEPLEDVAVLRLYIVCFSPPNVQ